MVPTALAKEMAGPIRSALEQVEAVPAADRTFDPARSDRVFTIGLSDYAAFLLLSGLPERVERRAPNVRLVVRNTSRVPGLSMSDAGEAEPIAGNFPPHPGHMSEDLLCMEEFLCAGRRDHPFPDERLDAETCLGLRHLHVSLKGEPEGYLDDIIRSRELRRDVVVTAGHFLIAPFLLPVTDAEPRRIMEPPGKLLDLKIVPPPSDIPPFKVTQVRHKRYAADRGHQWLRELTREAVATLEPAGQER